MNTPPCSSTSFPLLPEEILEQIIYLSFFSSGSEVDFTSPLPVMLTCKSFYRIAKPLLYSCLHIRTRQRSERLAEILRTQPTLAAYIRLIRIESPSASEAFLAATQALSKPNDPSKHVLDVLDVGLIQERSCSPHQKTSLGQFKEDLGRLNAALSLCPDTKCLIVRQDAYASFGAVISFTHALASGVTRWKNLEAVDLRMRPTPLPTRAGSPRPDPLAAALANAPNLKVVRARQPALLNSFILDVANNQSLQRIELVGSSSGISDSVLPLSRVLRPPFTVGWRPNQSTTLRQPNGTSRQPECDEPTYSFPFGHAVEDPGLLQAATVELERQLENEPQTLFASQIIAHSRLSALIRAGRLQLIADRIVKSRRLRSTISHDGIEQRNTNVSIA